MTGFYMKRNTGLNWVKQKVKVKITNTPKQVHTILPEFA